MHADSPRIHGGYRSLVRAAYVLAMSFLLLSGCGGDGGTLTRREFAQKADAICAEGKRKTAALATPTTLPELARLADQTADLLGDALDDLRGLEPPVRERKFVDQWLTGVERLESDVREIGRRAQADNRGAVSTLAAKAQKRNARVNELATQLGMTVCNRG